MIFAGVRLPDQIRIALEEDRLVLFVGAGVSQPPPSSLPLFNRLTCEICSQPSVTSGKEDQVLGKLARNGTDVHAVAAKLLYHPKTRPTELHRQVLKLFNSPDEVRIVTTNFDDHLSTAARSVFRQEAVKEFYAPALPLGDDFNGIVYLHGSARENPKEMVLTDKNFGSAYLTRGWARDFLVALFSEYTVLFLGYSHSDVTTTYLARGLNKSHVKPRWALVSSDMKQEAEDHWAHLEIGVQQYSIDPTNKENAHQALTNFFVEWTKHNKESLLHRSRKMKGIATGLPPEAENESEYLEFCLQHPRLAKDFCNAVRHPAWVGWMNTKGYFKAFFGDSKEDLQPYQQAIAHWLATFVRRKHPELLLELIHANLQRLSRSFTHLLGHVVWSDPARSADPNFGAWVSLLLSQGENALSQEMWAYLLQECNIPKDSGISLRMFEILTTPRLQLRECLSLSAMRVDGEEMGPKWGSLKNLGYEIAWPDEVGSWVRKAWEEVFRSNLELIGEPLALLATKQISFAHSLLCGVSKGSGYMHTLNRKRSSISKHEQDQYALHDCLSVLIDVLRDVLRHWLETQPVRARAQIDAWWSSKFLLLQRLAVFGVSVDGNLTHDERLEWLLSNDLIFRFGMKKEVFDVLAAAYPQSSGSIRKKLLRRIQQGFKGGLRKQVGPYTDSYEQFNVLIWLQRADVNCRFVAAAITAIKEVYPKFVKRDHPEFDHWSGEMVPIDATEGLNADEILAEPPGGFMTRLLEADECSIRRDRWAHVSILPTLFRKDKIWGREFTQSLVTTGKGGKELWNGVFSAWRQVITTKEDWNWILDVVEGLPELPEMFAGVAALVADLWRSDNEPRRDDTIIVKAGMVMERAWRLCSLVEEAPDDSYRDWLCSAINHEGGAFGDFWVHYCNHLQDRAGKDWKGIPLVLKSMMGEAITGVSRIKVYARIAMTPWMGYIFSCDKKFATQFCLPLLDWKRDPVVAQQTWSVLLNYGYTKPLEMELQLLPYYSQLADQMNGMVKQAVEKVDQLDLDEHATRNFGYYLAGIVMKAIQNPLKSGFFREFLPRLPERVRGALAQGIGDYLEAAPRMVAQIWSLWLCKYVDSRLVGVPIALSHEETRAMADWCLYLDVKFPDAVERIRQMRLTEVCSFSVIEKLLKSPLLEKFPRESCRYVNVVMKAERNPFPHEEYIQLRSKFKETLRGTAEFKEFEELLYLWGWKN